MVVSLWGQDVPRKLITINQSAMPFNVHSEWGRETVTYCELVKENGKIGEMQFKSKSYYNRVINAGDVKLRYWKAKCGTLSRKKDEKSRKE